MRDLNGKMSHVPSGPYGGTSRGADGERVGSQWQAVRTTCRKAQHGLRAWMHQEFSFIGRNV